MTTYVPDRDFLEDAARAEGWAPESGQRAEPESSSPSASQPELHSLDAAKSRHFPCLDGLRALAALSVVIYHVATNTGVVAHHPALQAYQLSLGSLGVCVFFGLSGFLLYRPFAAALMADRGAPSTVNFYWRRFLRIFPAYWAAFTVFAFVLGYESVHGLRAVVRYYGLFQIYDRTKVLSGLGQAWSLGTELSFYLCIPLLALLVGHVVGRGRGRERDVLRAQMVLVAALVAGSLAFRGWLFWVAPSSARYATTWLPARLDWFAGGMTLAVASTWRGGRSWAVAVLEVAGRRTATCWALAAGLYVLICHLGIPGGFRPATADEAWISFLLFAVLAFLVLVPLVFGAQDRGFIRRALRSRPLSWLGTVSYGIFLWHVVWIRQLVQLRTDHASLARLGFWPFLGLTVALSVMTAAASYYLLERPALSLKDKGIFGRRRPPGLHAPRPDAAGVG